MTWPYLAISIPSASLAAARQEAARPSSPDIVHPRFAFPATRRNRPVAAAPVRPAAPRSKYSPQKYRPSETPRRSKRSCRNPSPRAHQFRDLLPGNPASNPSTPRQINRLNPHFVKMSSAEPPVARLLLLERCLQEFLRRRTLEARALGAYRHHVAGAIGENH